MASLNCNHRREVAFKYSEVGTESERVIEIAKEEKIVKGDMNITITITTRF